MTQMQSPYQDQSDVALYQEPDRTSIMAIMSLIFGVGGCCLGLTSIPAILLGIFSLLGISRSKGRVGGTGFGIAGLLIGIITLALWGGAIGAGVYGLNQMVSVFGAKTEQILLDIQADNFDSSRALMRSPAADVSDEQMIEFRESYQAAMGDLVSKPDGIGDLLSGYVAVGEAIQPYNGRPGFIPIPMRFDSGFGLVIYVMDPNSTSDGDLSPNHLIVIDADGNEYILPPGEINIEQAIQDIIHSDEAADAEAEIDADSGADPDMETDGTDDP